MRYKKMITRSIALMMMGMSIIGLTACGTVAEANSSAETEAEVAAEETDTVGAEKLTVYFAAGEAPDGVLSYIKTGGLYYITTEQAAEAAAEGSLVFTDGEGNVITVTSSGSYSSDTGKALLKILGVGDVFAGEEDQILTVSITTEDADDDEDADDEDADDESTDDEDTDSESTTTSSGKTTTSSDSSTSGSSGSSWTVYINSSSSGSSAGGSSSSSTSSGSSSSSHTHKWVSYGYAWEYVDEDTCKKVYTYRCSSCGEEYTEETEYDHEWSVKTYDGYTMTNPDFDDDPYYVFIKRCQGCGFYGTSDEYWAHWLEADEDSECRKHGFDHLCYRTRVTEYYTTSYMTCTHCGEYKEETEVYDTVTEIVLTYVNSNAYNIISVYKTIS